MPYVYYLLCAKRLRMRMSIQGHSGVHYYSPFLLLALSILFQPGECSRGGLFADGSIVPHGENPTE